MAYNLGYVDGSGYNTGYSGAFTGGPSISAADDAVEAQSETVTITNYTLDPTELRLDGDVVSFTFDAGVLTYTAPLLPNNPSLGIEVDVDGVTLSDTIAYTNTYPYTHTPTIVDDDSIIPETSFGTNQLVELKVVTDADPLILDVDWDSYDADNFVSSISDFITPATTDASTTDVVIGYHITETGAFGTFTRTLSLSGTSVLLPPDGTQVVTLTSWAGSAVFPQTPVAGDQIVAPSTITIGVDGVVDAPAGSYLLTLIEATGTAHSIDFEVLPTIVTTDTTVAAPSGTTSVTLTSWAGDASFSPDPVSGDQLLGPDTLTLNADGTVTGADGTYTLTLIRDTGEIESVSYTISDVVPTDVFVSSTLSPPAGWSSTTLSSGFDMFLFSEWDVGDQPAVGDQILMLDAEGSISTDAVLTTDFEGDIDCVLIRQNGNSHGFYIESDGLAVFGVGTQVETSTTISAPAGWTFVALASGFDTTLFSDWNDPIPTAGDFIGTEDVSGTWNADGTFTTDLESTTIHSVLIRESGSVEGFNVDSTQIPEVGSGADIVPDTFTFTDVTDQPLGEIVESNTITVAGVDAGEDIPVSITGGEYAVDTGSGFGGFTSANTTVQLGYQIKVRVTTSASNATGVSATLTVGGVSDTFTATTVANSYTAPTLTLVGGDITFSVGDVFVDPGFSASDTIDGDLTSSVVVTGVNMSAVGQYTITYSVTNGGGLTTSDTRTLTIIRVGISGFVIRKNGAISGNLTGAEIRIVAGELLSGDEIYYSPSGTTDGSGMLADIDLSGNALLNGNIVLFHILTDDGHGAVVPITLEDLDA